MQQHTEPDIHCSCVSVFWTCVLTVTTPGELLWLAGCLRSHGLSFFFVVFFVPTSFAALSRPHWAAVSCLSSRGRSFSFRGDIKATPFRHCFDVIMQHAATEDDHGTFRCWPCRPGLLPWRCICPCHSRLRLAALRVLVGQRGQSGVHQWGGGEQFKPADHHVGQVQIIQ